ncbi:hypothetical protein [Algoriphagus chordae]|nr:hypothetical protein [Algoriphagus chordae]
MPILLYLENANQIDDWNTWCPGAKIGEVIDTELNPVVGGRATFCS